jgi:hypothetical protein
MIVKYHKHNRRYDLQIAKIAYTNGRVKVAPIDKSMIIPIEKFVNPALMTLKAQCKTYLLVMTELWKKVFELLVGQV